MAFAYNIKGIELTMTDMVNIHKYYEAACTAEYLMENYDHVTSEEQALALGYEVRNTMDKYGIDEMSSIDHLIYKGVF